MKTVTYTCDNCDKSSPQEMQTVSFAARDTHTYTFANIHIGHLCADCLGKLKNEVLVSFKNLELKYKTALIEPEA
ncbi:hypothetical protein [Limnobaculum xujianqingii]|uniref:hypothetical protein n=1 Tax=Limnobaculum xujianqingii TaxID=2738837 RepID=UPI0011283056|nr:hypothetical protein [Limnobaculum xujianqingii]